MVEKSLLPDELFARRIAFAFDLGDIRMLSKSIEDMSFGSYFSLMCSNRFESWSKTDDFESKFFIISEDSFSFELLC